MKKLILISFSLLLATNVAQASFVDKLKEYGLPCLAGFAVGALASKKEGGAIGLAVCAGVSTSTYLRSTQSQINDEDFKNFIKMMDKHSQENLKAYEQALNEKQKERIDSIQEVISQVLSERIVLAQEDLRKEASKMMKDAGYMKEVEDKVHKRVLDETEKSLKGKYEINKREIVEETVDAVLKEIVLKKVGRPE